MVSIEEATISKIAELDTIRDFPDSVNMVLPVHRWPPLLVVTLKYPCKAGKEIPIRLFEIVT